MTNVPTPSASDAAACRKLNGLLPDEIGDGLKTRTVHPDSPFLHAWGTPAVVLRCGVGYPPDYQANGITGEVNGIFWYPTQTPDAVVYTAVDRLPRVSIAVPDHYQQAFDVLASLAPVMKAGTSGR